MNEADRIIARTAAQSDQFLMKVRDRYKLCPPMPKVLKIIRELGEQGGEHAEVAELARYGLIEVCQCQLEKGA